MKKINIISLIFVLALIAYVFYHNYDKTPADRAVTVIMTDEGFSPDKVITEAGTTITWVNQSTHPRWPASNFHPNHTLYPEPGGCLGSMLDACRGLQIGESFSFKFDKLGIWPMHDHLFPGMVMTVEVVKQGEAGNQESLRYDEKTTLEEFRQFDYGKQLEFIKIMSTDSPGDAWSYVKKAFIVNNQVVGNAHEFAHIIGNASYKRSGIDGVKICDATFAFGCFHGVTEAMLLKEGPSKIKDIEIGCLKIFPPNVSQDYTGCIHGTGHGIYTWEGGDLNKALLDCDIISEQYRSYCYDGVFMENSGELANINFDPKNPWKLCIGLDERYHRNCARYQSQIFLAVAGLSDSVAVVGKNCALGPSVLTRETCFESLGYYVAQNSLGNPEIVWKKCATITDKTGSAICVTGAAIETIFQKYGNFEQSAKSLCGKLEQPHAANCLGRIGGMLK